jgi:hypothetical protein
MNFWDFSQFIMPSNQFPNLYFNFGIHIYWNKQFPVPIGQWALSSCASPASRLAHQAIPPPLLLLSYSSRWLSATTFLAHCYAMPSRRPPLSHGKSTNS